MRGSVTGAVAVVGIAVAAGVGGEVARAHDADGGNPGGVFGESADLALEEVKGAHDYRADCDAGKRPEGSRHDIVATPGGRGVATVVIRGGGGDQCERCERKGGNEGQAEDERLHTGVECSENRGCEPPCDEGNKKGPVDVWSGHSIQRDPTHF